MEGEGGGDEARRRAILVRSAALGLVVVGLAMLMALLGFPPVLILETFGLAILLGLLAILVVLIFSDRGLFRRGLRLR